MSKKYPDLMLDLETLGTDRHSAILQIGACMFSMAEGASPEQNDRFVLAIDPGSCQDYGLVIDPGTVMWWLRGVANEEAYRNAVRGMSPMYSLSVALRQFDTFWRTHNPERIWSCGADFDVPILENAFRKVGVVNSPPWKYWQIRDVRTMRWLADVDKVRNAPDAHSALGDAVRQADEMARCWAKLRTPWHGGPTMTPPQEPDGEGA